MNRRTPTPKHTPPAIQFESSCAQPVPNLKIPITRLNKATTRPKGATAPFIVLTAPQQNFMTAGKRGKKEKY